MIRAFIPILATLAAQAALPGIACADAPVIEHATVTANGGTWNISVTLRHPDTGWDHYADGWQVLTPGGETLGTRELLHPHVTEQPFTRSLGNVKIPPTVTHVLIRARDNVDGWAEATYRLELHRE